MDQGDWAIFLKQFATFVHFYFRCCAGNADAKLCIYQSRSCSTSHLRLRGKIIFPPWASVLSSIDQRAKWVSGQEGGGGEINFPGFPNLHSAAKKSICLIYREPAGGGEIAPTDQHNVQLRLEGIWCHACNINMRSFFTQISQEWRKKEALVKVTTKMIPKSVGGWEMTLQDDAGLWISHTLQVTQSTTICGLFVTVSISHTSTTCSRKWYIMNVASSRKACFLSDVLSCS